MTVFIALIVIIRQLSTYNLHITVAAQYPGYDDMSTGRLIFRPTVNQQ